MFFKLIFLFLIAFSNCAISSIIYPDHDPANTFILRLGSCPTSKGTWAYQKEDNSYQEWLSGNYKKHIEENDIPFKNIIHNYITEIQPVARKWEITPVHSHINEINNTDDSEPTYITVDFNSDRFNSGISQLMSNLNNPECLFDCIITDNRTAKFVSPAGLSNLISRLKIGGIAIFTDLDENYGWQFDEDCMFLKQSKEIFNMFGYLSDSYTKSRISAHYKWKTQIEYLKETGLTTEEAIETLDLSKDMLAEFQLSEDTKMLGLFDLVFGDCPEDKIVDSEYLRQHHIDIVNETRLKINFYKNILTCHYALRFSSLPSADTIRYLLTLGNKRFEQESRVIMIERIG